MSCRADLLEGSKLCVEGIPDEGLCCGQLALQRACLRLSLSGGIPCQRHYSPHPLAVQTTTSDERLYIQSQALNDGLRLSYCLLEEACHMAGRQLSCASAGPCFHGTTRLPSNHLPVSILFDPPATW